MEVKLLIITLLKFNYLLMSPLWARHSFFSDVVWGKIEFSRLVYAPESIIVVPLEGESHDITQEVTVNIYNYEVAEVINCLEQGKFQRTLWSCDDSLMLIGIIDEIRAQIGFVISGIENCILTYKKLTHQTNYSQKK